MDLDEIEGQLTGFKAISDSLNRKVGRIEIHNKELSKRINKIEIQDLQNQIISLHKELLEIGRFLAKHNIDSVENILRDNLYKQFSNNRSSHLYSEALNYISYHSGISREKTDVSLEPLEEAKNYTKECKIYFDKHHFKGFIE
jgi:hypothetical protein